MSTSQDQQQQQQQQQQHAQQHHHRPKYGPPQHIKPRQYHASLELLESQANKKLTNEYSTELVQTMSHLESVSSVNPAMIDLQPEIQWFMRPFLLDFLIELHSSFRLQPQTLFLCLNIIDRYCAKRIVFKRHYQLVGCTALWIAGKYEDKKSRVPTLKELTIMCRNAYDEEMFVQMEMHILSTLEWSIGHPTLEDCLQLSIKHSSIISPSITPPKYNLQTRHAANGNGANDQVLKSASASTLSAVTVVGRFLCELSLYDKFFLSVPTSLVAYTANLLACSMLQIPNASISLKELLENVLIEPKRKQYLQAKLQNRLKRKQERQLRRQQQQQQQQQSIKTKFQNVGAAPKFPLRQKLNTLYSNNNDSNYSHQTNIYRHSSIADDIDLDYEENDQENIDTDTDTDRDADIDHDALDDEEPVFNDTNDTTFDNEEHDEIENKSPEIHGAFLNGLDESTLLTIKKIALLLIIQLNKVTEVLTKKYEAVGVIHVLKKFHEKNSFLIQSIYENKDKIIATCDSATATIDSRFIQTIEILLQFPQLSDPTLDSDSESDSEDDEEEYCVNPYSSYKAYESDDYFSVRGSGAGHLRTPKSPHPFFGPSTLGFDSNVIAPPVTPPSATSQYSVFSNKRSGGSQTNSVTSNCNTPTHFPVSSFASTSGMQQSQQQSQQQAVMMGSSSSSSSLQLCRTKSKIRKKRAMMQSSAGNGPSVMIPPILPTVTTGHETRSGDKLSPIKPVVSSSNGLNTSSPLMNQYF
ncbi:G1/S-specific cyclin CCN1 [Candida parapsilosis]|uniref:Cyclin N-terminal domain-containing protein n=1 Tax=Candida parapsilosis (strain CDC 317 / ATCC MYA-4646) TaxID=578454 RepID=G8B9S5_CANPC|nr:uncharacterized protein CPAR2_303660 [Candida parapsilosis]KAI5905207.1 G1/S-specific cyclin CCN1 [Candida parapsilosis]KAI5907860.1 G1/S-specific cyclin CCN1 [Candida parapsilosis]CAD1811855.1 unnamed protein product [Candida parapsilosis]CCE41377.1 hypothetical protein CPAR2_303660 [Candida parapsilosis]